MLASGIVWSPREWPSGFLTRAIVNLIALLLPGFTIVPFSTAHSPMVSRFTLPQGVQIVCVMSVRVSVCPSAWNSSAVTERILMKFGILAFLENLWRKFDFDYNLSIITGTLREDLSTYMIISRWILLRMRTVSDKSCRENHNTQFVFSIFFFWKSCR